MDKKSPLYNSRITRAYLEFIKKKYHHIDIDDLLKYANMTKYEVNDTGHWFNQTQVDRFQEILIRKTGNENIAREAGRYSTSIRGVNAFRQYLLSFMSLSSLYMFMGKLYNIMSRGAFVKTKKLRSNKVQIESTPKPGVMEKPYQCKNRMGTFESVALLFTGKFATIEHPECFHKGGDCCRYVITWEKTPYAIWKTVRNYSLLLCIFTIPVLSFFLPVFSWSVVSLTCVFIVIIFSFYTAYFEKKELIKTIESHGDEAKGMTDEMNIRYDNALFIQEISRVAATLLNVDELVNTVTRIIEKHLDFDRGIVMLANREKTRLIYSAGYGYNEQDKQVLRQTKFHLDNPDSTGVFVKSHKDQKPFLVDNIKENGKRLSPKSRNLVDKMDVQSLICAPIIYEKESLGILAVDNVRSKRPLTQSDINLLSGVASQLALGIANARSFQKLQESEEKYRTVLESIEEGYFEVDLAGNFTFVNEATCKILRYEKNELIGINNRNYMDKKNAKKIYHTFNKVYLNKKPAKVVDWELIRKDGSTCIVEISVSLIKDGKNRPAGFRGVAREVTDRKRAERERKRLETQLQNARKMEALGTLAGGVAHDLNNILSGLVSYPELLLMEIPEDSPLRRPLMTIQNSGEKAATIVQDLLTLARRGVPNLKPVNLNEVIIEYLKSPEYTKLKAYYPEVKVDVVNRLDSELFNISGSHVHLSKTVMNIISNAIEAIQGPGKVTVSTNNRYIDKPITGYDYIEEGDYVVFTVSDTGIGISPEDMERIFEPFYTKKVMGRSGTGLGMAVVWGTVKDHKGYIDVQSKVGKGTTFNLYFPVTRMGLLKEESPLSMKDYMGKGETILIVDDVDEQREIASGMLKKLGYDVTSVSSGEQAVEYLKNHKADLLVLDMIMSPGIDGLETYRQILELYPEQKAIIASGFSETDKVKETQRLGAGTYIKKPYKIEKIGTIVRAELDNEFIQVL
ncbi:MAG: PAS domain S-box protein [Thermodesulfobacteriota bacterium]|nr:PAS domain S-box protein [Thermodesulfobacteriota bacterium]